MDSKLRGLYSQLSQLNYFRELTEQQKVDVLVQQYIAVELQTNDCVQIVNNSGEVLSTTEWKAIYGLSPAEQIQFNENVNEVSEQFEHENNDEYDDGILLDEKQLVKAQYSMISSKKKIIGYQCQYPGCDFKERKKSRVQTHVNETHTGIPTFKCNYCGAYFRNNNDRNKHKKAHKNSLRQFF